MVNTGGGGQLLHFLLIFRDYLSASLLRQVQLQCSPDKGVEPSLPMILTAFIEDKVVDSYERITPLILTFIGSSLSCYVYKYL